MLSSDIMNLQTRINGEVGDPHSYRLGHRDARHDASELVLKYERYIEELEGYIGSGVTIVFKRKCGLAQQV